MVAGRTAKPLVAACTSAAGSDVEESTKVLSNCWGCSCQPSWHPPHPTAHSTNPSWAGHTPCCQPLAPLLQVLLPFYGVAFSTTVLSALVQVAAVKRQSEFAALCCECVPAADRLSGLTGAGCSPVAVACSWPWCPCRGCL